MSALILVPANECHGAATEYSMGFQPQIGIAQGMRPEGAQAVEWPKR